jgi:hypothetical protein
VNNSAHHK